MGKTARLKDSAKYAVLASVFASEDAKEGTKLNHADVGAYRTKTVKAGEYLYISCYPLIAFNADREQRKRLVEWSVDREKSAKLRTKYAKYNNKRRCMEFEQLVHANFERGDLHICCTYARQDYEQYSTVIHRTREDAKKDIRNYLRRVRRLLKKHGCSLEDFRWICCTATKASLKESAQPRPDTHHHHLLVHGVPDSLRRDIEDLWQLGYCNADRMRDSESGLAGVAGYIARQENSANGENNGRRSYSTSKNIIRPSISTADNRISRRRVAQIAADVQVNGCEIFEKLFGEYRMVENARVDISDITAGAYIYAKLRRKDGRQTQNRPRRTPARMIA